mmetsp:Transcript_7931/g.19982  ORF Transcript_7931/g.19982 Transcript_7931/m.19982 type:complete len:571 (+) Transcript_7931:90-1802(+)
MYRVVALLIAATAVPAVIVVAGAIEGEVCRAPGCRLRDSGTGDWHTVSDSSLLQTRSKPSRSNPHESLVQHIVKKVETVDDHVFVVSPASFALRVAALLVVVLGVFLVFAAPPLPSWTKSCGKNGACGPTEAVAQDEKVGMIAESRRYCTEIKVSGMTCSACSSTVERCLRNQHGVESATVNLVLEKATVVYNADVVTAAALCEEVEDVGFEASTLSNDLASELQDEGKATLHLEVGAEFIEPVGSFVSGVAGVIAWRAIGQHMIQVTYRPLAVGARSLLGQLIKKFPECTIRCAPPQDNNQIADLQRNVERLWFNFKCSAIPAFLVFVITIVLPSFHVDLGTIDCKSIHIHLSTVAVLALATPVQFVFGADFHVQARKALARRAPNMDVLVSLATHISYGYAILVLITKVCKALGHHNDMTGERDSMGFTLGLECHALHFFGMAPILMAVVLCGKLIESKAKIQTMESLVRLMECKSQTAQLVTDEKEEAISVELVQVDDRLRFFEGSQIPVDGILITEDSVWVSEAILTGESTPTEKKKRQHVDGGHHRGWWQRYYEGNDCGLEDRAR